MKANEEDQTTATNNFISHNPADRLQSNINIVQRSNFSQRYERNRFSHQFKEHTKARNSRRMKDSNNKYVYYYKTIKNGYVKEEFMKKNNIIENSHPANWFKLFLPNRVDKVTKYGTDTWNTCTNLKGFIIKHST